MATKPQEQKTNLGFLFGSEAEQARSELVRLTKECQERNKARKAYEEQRKLAHQNREIIIQNAAWDIEHDIYYQSIGRHDYITWENSGGKFMIDGGRAYFRSCVWDRPGYSVPLYLTNTSSAEDVITKLLWGSYGKDGKQPLTWRPIRMLETDHLLAILANVTFKSPLDPSLLVIIEILKQRGVEVPVTIAAGSIYDVFKDG
jgi:hypothetical protein